MLELPTSKNISKSLAPAPFLRWAGGKRMLLPVLVPLLDAALHDSVNCLKKRVRYYEPFLGGGAVFFGLSGLKFQTDFDDSNMDPQISDMNEDLVNCYSTLKSDVDQLILALTEMEKDISEESYYRVRDLRPTSNVERAARLIFLNRLCFNGLYRVNRKGEFNVPYGRLAKPVVCNEQLLRTCSTALKFATLRTGDFEDALINCNEGDVAYFDPPYVPISSTSNFSSYHSSPFGQREHERLALLVNDLANRGARVVVSNSDTEITRELFSRVQGVNTYATDVSRSISATSDGRTRVTELVITNVPVDDRRLTKI